VRPVPLRAQSFLGSPERVRFRVVGDELIATPGGHGIASGRKAFNLRNTRSDQCYAAFMSGSSMSITGLSAWP